MKHPTLISFVRHGQVDNPDGVFYGRLEGFPLDENGRRQARAAAEILRSESIAAVYSSPLLRTKQTAQIVAEFHPDSRILESDLISEARTPFDGYPISELEARSWNVYDGAGPGYEQPADLCRRVQQFVAEVRRDFAGRHVIAVTHGDNIAFMILWAGGLPITPHTKQRLHELGVHSHYPARASITTFVYATTLADEIPRYEYIEPC